MESLLGIFVTIGKQFCKSYHKRNYLYNQKCSLKIRSFRERLDLSYKIFTRLCLTRSKQL